MTLSPPPPRAPWVVVILGATALAAVTAWRAASASYDADLETICRAEARSGWAMRDDMSRVTEWVRARLVTARGNELFSALEDEPVGGRIDRLRAEAAARRLPCPTIDAYEKLLAEARSRAGFQRLCSTATFPDLPARSAQDRAEVIEAWIAGQPAGSRLRDLERPWRDAATAEQRARVLREAARSAGVLTCDAANALLAPDPVDGGADVRPPSP